MSSSSFRLRYSLPHSLRLALLYGRYCQHVYHRHHDPRHKIPAFAEIPIEIKSELRQLVSVIYDATRTKYDLHFKVRNFEPAFLSRSRYQTKNPRGPPLIRFPEGSQHHQIQVGPAIYYDEEGHPVAYHLPSAIQKHRLEIFNLHVELSANRGKGSINPSNPFMPVDESCASNQAFFYTHDELVSGCSRLAPAQLIDENRGFFAPSVPLLDSKYRGMALLESVSETLAIIGAAMSVIHPPSFFAGFRAFEQLYKNPKAVTPHYILSDVLSVWSSPHSLFRIYNNYDSGVRREDVTPPLAFDTLLSAGTSEENRLVCPTLGHEFYFQPGTLFVGMTRLLYHGWTYTGYDPHIVAIASFDEAVVKHAIPDDMYMFSRRWSPQQYSDLASELQLDADAQG